MTGPKPPGKKDRVNRHNISEEEQLYNEAVGPGRASLKRALAAPHQGKKEEGEGFVKRVMKKIFD